MAPHVSSSGIDVQVRDGTVGGSSETVSMSMNVGGRTSTGGRNARPRDGMTSASNDNGNFSPRCLSLDLRHFVPPNCGIPIGPVSAGGSQSLGIGT